MAVMDQEDHKTLMHIEQNLSDPSSSSDGAGQPSQGFKTADQVSGRMDDFQYGPILDENHIRLLRILRDSDDDIIRCTLETYELAQVPDYDALSYVWGDGSPDHTIVCSGKELKVTKSVHRILLALKRQRSFKYTNSFGSKEVPGANLLWIDQICINQQRTDEQDRQVRIMRHVYQKARRVLISLGQDFPSPAVAAVERLLNACGNMALPTMSELLRMQHFPRDPDLIRLGLPVASDDCWPALERLLLLPYFTRVWVVQEATVAREALVIFDEVAINWNFFIETINLLYATSFHLRDTSLDSTDFTLPYIEIVSLYAQFKTSMQTLEQRPLYSLVRQTRHLDSKYPKDKIYALAGLAFDGDKITIEYNKPDWEVFCDFARYTIAAEKNLNILSDITEYDQDRGNSNTPSWVPRWDTSSPVLVWIEREFNAACSSEVSLHPQQDFKVLTVKGRRLAVITDKVAHRVPSTEDWTQHFPSFILHLIDKGFVVDSEDPQTLSTQRLKELAWCTILGEYHFLWTNTAIGDASDNLLHDFVAWLANCFIQAFHQQDEETLNSVVPLAKIVFDADAEYILGRPDLYATFSRESKDLVERHKKQIFERIPGLLKDQTDMDDLYIKAARSADFQMSRRFEAAVCAFIIKAASVYITDRGSMGIGGSTLKEGDIICVLYGGSRPYALRPTSKTGEYTFQGDCYVHGMMHGEGFQDDNAERDEWFSLV